MSKLPRWYHKWSDNYGTKYSIYTVNAIEQLRIDAEAYTSRSIDKDKIVVQMLHLNVLNSAQTATLCGVSRQHVANIISRLNVNEPTNTVRGEISGTGLSYIREILTRLIGNEIPPDDILHEAQTWAGKAVIHHLTGIPLHILVKASKDVEAEYNLGPVRP